MFSYTRSQSRQKINIDINDIDFRSIFILSIFSLLGTLDICLSLGITRLRGDMKVGGSGKRCVGEGKARSEMLRKVER